MQIKITNERDQQADTLVLFLSEEDKLTQDSPISEKLLEAMKERGDFTGKFKETCVVYEKKHRIVLVGLGHESELNAEKMRLLAAVCMKQIVHLKNSKIVTLEMPEGLKNKEQIALLEGFYLSRYGFHEYKKSKVTLEQIHVLFASKVTNDSLKDLEIIASGVDLARDLVNLNADTVTPTRLSQEAIHLATIHASVKTTVLRKKELENLKAGLILAVSQGAVEEPALIIMEYHGDPDSKEKPVALVGKGITFDTGGLNLKPTGSIETMKCDMAGAATVLGVIKAAAELKLKRNIVGVIASCENAIGPQAYKPGDVIVSMSGKTVEVNNTDAEGRLVLSDAITYIQHHMGIKTIIDLATLTGAITIALGEEAAGLFTRSSKLKDELLEASEKTGEKLWPMPLYDEFKEQLKSSIADMKNSGKRLGGASTGALFIEAFVDEGTQWAHLDIAGVAYLSEPRTYHTTLATGFGVRLLLNYLGV
jgi:leucyl aminopeptidase